MQRGSFKMMKSVNKSLILNQIRLNQPISRAEIAKQTKLTPPTVSAIVKELINENLVKETELGQSKGGRKPTMLQINHQGHYIVGIDIGPSMIHSLLTDMAGNKLKSNSYALDKSLSETEFLNTLKIITNEMLNNAPSKEHVIGIGVAMHGVVNVTSGTSLFAPNLQLKNIPIKSFLEEECQKVVYVENDARAMALGESWFGKHIEQGPILAINLSTGVGAGLIINGELYHGFTDIAGEVGHMTIDINGPICECGNKGCFQTFATGNAIVREANRNSNSNQYASAEEVFQEASKGNTHCIQALEKTATYIGIALTNLIHIMNPSLIVLGGGVTKSKDFLLPIINREIKNRTLTEKASETIVKITHLGKDATLYGAISLVLKDIFE